MRTKEQLRIVDFCARECALQGSGEMSVSWMVQAWIYAIRMHDRFTGRHEGFDMMFLERLCRTIEPVKNGGEHVWRRVPVTVRGTEVIGSDWRDIPRQLANLIDAQRRLTPTEFYRAFEEIHPCLDGNGRAGCILFQWLNGSLTNPVWPPNLWDDPRRAGPSAP